MLKELMKMVKALEKVGDIEFDDWGNVYDITFCDFEDYDENGNLIMREYENKEGVRELQDWLEKNCVSRKGNYIVTYEFDNFDVEMSFTSFDN